MGGLYFFLTGKRTRAPGRGLLKKAGGDEVLHASALREFLKPRESSRKDVPGRGGVHSGKRGVEGKTTAPVEGKYPKVPYCEKAEVRHTGRDRVREKRKACCESS